MLWLVCGLILLLCFLAIKYKRVIITTFFPGLDTTNYKKFALLGLMLYLILGSYWLLRLMKQTIVFKIAFSPDLGWDKTASEYFQTMLKIWSPWLILILVMIYSKFVVKIKRHHLLSILWGSYACIFVVLALFFLTRELHLIEYGKITMAVIGFSSYLVIESFGALAVVMFWAFTNSITSDTNASKGFPIIYAIAHFGGFCFSTILHLGEYTGFWPLILLSSVAILTAIWILNKFVSTIPKEKIEKPSNLPKTTTKNEGPVRGFIAGLTLIFKNPYLVGIFIISTFYEILSQVMEFQMNRTAKDIFTTDQYTHFQAFFGQAVNMVTILISFIGASFILRKFGVRISLLIFPSISAIVFISLFFYTNLVPTINQFNLLIFFTIAMITIKGTAYSLNNPSKEIMWIPTTKEIKFRSKGWIDSFGARLLKSKAGAINMSSIGSSDINFIYFICFGVIIIWFISALALGKKNRKLIRNNEIIS